MYFFIDPNNLPQQELVDAYGPASVIENSDGTESPSDPTSIYNTTSRFQLVNEEKAFACQKGMMIVQQSSVHTSLVNVVIKPNTDLKVPLGVAYYIYRGILKSSLIGADNCILNEASNNQFIQSILDDPRTPSEPVCGILGYDDQNVINDTVIVDKVFENEFAGISPHDIKEGEWFGTFTKDHKIGFEIVLKTNRFKVTLGYVRAENHQVDVTGLVNYAERIKREEILNFIDPAAFFGMHFKNKVKYYDTATNTTKKTTTNASGSNSDRFIYTKIISKFQTKNKLYIDIRSEKGYSYNFYQNYNDGNSNNIQVSANIVPGTQAYQKDNWPILIVESNHTSGSTNSFRFRLKISTDNPKPILYMKRLKYKGNKHIKHQDSKSRYFTTKTLIGNGANADHTDWTNELRLKLPNTLYYSNTDSNTGSARNYIANYVRLHYFKSTQMATTHNTTTPNTVLENIHYYDSPFCSIDIPDLGDIIGKKRHVESANPIYVREPNNTDGTGNFQLNMDNGAYWDTENILFYATIEYEDSRFKSGKEYINTYSQKLEFNACGPLNKYCESELYNKTDIICREYTNSNAVNIRIPGVNYYNTHNTPRFYTEIIRNVTYKREGSTGVDHKENAMLLGLTLAELESIKGTVPTGSFHHRYIHLVPSNNNPILNNNIKHFEYELQIQTIDDNGVRVFSTPTHLGSAITLYSRDNQFFSSSNFSANIPLTTTQNQLNLREEIEFHIYENGTIKINDNIDLALYYDTNDDDNDDYGFVNIFYKYIDANNVNNSICNLKFTMAYRMKRNIPRTALGNRYPDEFEEVYDYNDDNIDGVDAGIVEFDDEIGDYVIQEKTGGSQYGTMRYIRNKITTQTQRIFMVRMVTNDDENPNGEIWYVNNGIRIYRTDTDNEYNPFRFQIDDFDIDLRYANTVRFYANPVLAAAVIGALIRFYDENQNANYIECQGFAYKDATSYPSTSHINGSAFDLTYKATMDKRGLVDLTQSEAVNEDGEFLSALYHFGFRQFLIGKNGSANHGTNATYITTLDDDYDGTVKNGSHEDHIHAYKFTTQ